MGTPNLVLDLDPRTLPIPSNAAEGHWRDEIMGNLTERRESMRPATALLTASAVAACRVETDRHIPVIAASQFSTDRLMRKRLQGIDPLVVWRLLDFAFCGIPEARAGLLAFLRAVADVLGYELVAKNPAEGCLTVHAVDFIRAGSDVAAGHVEAMADGVMNRYEAAAQERNVRRWFDHGWRYLAQCGLIARTH